MPGFQVPRSARRHAAVSILAPLQLGFCVRGGCEAIARSLSSHVSHRRQLMVDSLDLSNATSRDFLGGGGISLSLKSAFLSPPSSITVYQVYLFKLKLLVPPQFLKC